MHMHTQNKHTHKRLINFHKLTQTHVQNTISHTQILGCVGNCKDWTWNMTENKNVALGIKYNSTKITGPITSLDRVNLVLMFLWMGSGKKVGALKVWIAKKFDLSFSQYFFL